MSRTIDAILFDPIEHSRQQLNQVLSKIDEIKVRAETSLLPSINQLVQKFEPEMIFMDMSQFPNEALALAERISHNRPNVMIVMLSEKVQSDDIILAMRAGAREFLTKPFTEKGVRAALGRLIKFDDSRRDTKPLVAKTISLFGTKGGVGSTTIACSLAASLAKHKKKSVLLLDLDLQKGHCGTFLNLMPQFSILDVCNGAEGVEESMLKRVLEQHSSGVYLLAGSILPEDSEKVTLRQVEHLMMTLKAAFDFVIIDTSGRFDEITIKALDESDMLLTIVTPDLPAIFNARRCLETFRRMNYEAQKLRLVLNCHNPSDPDFGKLDRIGDARIDWKIPCELNKAVIRGINLGQPVTISAPNSVVGDNISSLAAWLNGESYPKAVRLANDKPQILKSIGRKLKWAY